MRDFWQQGGDPDDSMFEVLVTLCVRTGEFRKALQVVHAMDRLGRYADKMRIKKVLEEFYRCGFFFLALLCMDNSGFTECNVLDEMEHLLSRCGMHYLNGASLFPAHGFLSAPIADVCLAQLGSARHGWGRLN